jgi:hypothetical protein
MGFGAEEFGGSFWGRVVLGATSQGSKSHRHMASENPHQAPKKARVAPRSQNMLRLTLCDALDWLSFVPLLLLNRGDDDGKRQQLAQQGKEEAQEGSGAEADPGKGSASAQEAVTADRVCRTMSTQGWSSRQLVGLIPRSRGCESHPLRQLTPCTVGTQEKSGVSSF